MNRSQEEVWAITQHAKEAFEARFFRQYWMAKMEFEPQLGYRWLELYLQTLLKNATEKYASFSSEKRWLTYEDVTFLCINKVIVTIVVGRPIPHKHSRKTAERLSHCSSSTARLAYHRPKSNLEWKQAMQWPFSDKIWGNHIAECW